LNKKGILNLTWRGALGGALGGLLYYLLIVFKLWPDVPYFGLTLLIIPISGIFIGGMIGAVIWILQRGSGAELNVILRIIVGVIFAALLGGVIYWLSSKGESKVKDLMIGALSMGVTFGVLAGILARPRNS
jgi:hypothetical protein